MNAITCVQRPVECLVERADKCSAEGYMEPVQIAVCGLNYRTAPVAMLERLAFAPESRIQTLQEMIGGDVTPFGEAVILSTCNRVELYVAAPRCSLEDSDGGEYGLLARTLAGWRGVPVGEAAPCLYSYMGEAAARHLFTVAAGLDSLVFGEPQILGQVRQAFEDALSISAAGPILSSLFRRALETGKRVRSDTTVCQGAASVSYAAVEVAAAECGDLSGRRALVVGAGKTGQLAAQALRGRGVREITVANRSYEHAAELAEQLGGPGDVRACTLDGLQDALNDADIVVSCTNAPGYVITGGMVCRARAGGQETRPLLLIDIAVPRDIDPAATLFPGVRVCNIDDLHAVVEANLGQRRDAAGTQAAAIVEEGVAAFQAWFGALAVAPLITGLREQAEAIRQRELERAMHRLPDLPNNYANIIDMLTQRIVNQLLHQPTVRLKETASRADGPLYAQAVRELFALDDGQGAGRGQE